MNLIVSFHTPDTTYAHEANKLRSSVERLDLAHAIVEREPLGKSWALNNHIKPTTIREFHRGGKHGVLWVDADSIVWSDPWPTIKALGDIDIAVVWHEWQGKRAVFASTIYFAPTARAAAVLEDWIALCAQKRRDALRAKWDWKASDQQYFQVIIEDHERLNGLKIGALPRTMAYIHDNDRKRGTPGPAIIEAFQVSWVGRAELKRQRLPHHMVKDQPNKVTRTRRDNLDHSVTIEQLAAEESARMEAMTA